MGALITYKSYCTSIKMNIYISVGKEKFNWLLYAVFKYIWEFT